MKFVPVLTTIALAVALSACGSKDLTKEQAKAMLVDAFDKTPITQPVLTGMSSMGPVPEAEYFKNSADGKYQKALEGAGLVTITSKGKVVNPADKKQFFNALDIQLTDAGKKFISGTPKTVPPAAPGMWATVYENAAFCTREIVDVTSVATNEDFARAQYTYKFGKLTPFAEQYLKMDPTNVVTCNATKVQDAEGTFERKDDVWKYTSPTQ